MVKYVALLRAVNVGGTGKLPMTDLRAMCSDAGFTRVQTYIASGNVVFESAASPAKVKADLEARLLAYAGEASWRYRAHGGPDGSRLKGEPFPKAAPNHTVAIFLDKPPPFDALDHAVGMKDEEMRLGACEIFIRYGSGIGKSKLRIPAAKIGTARNMSTIAKLAEMASKP